jgi:hypothetical protein
MVGNQMGTVEIKDIRETAQTITSSHGLKTGKKSNGS